MANYFNKSPLFKYRLEMGYKVVHGIGKIKGRDRARFMFIGEAPGRNEAIKGIPFCGSAGKILDQLLIQAKLKRDDIYITNIVKDRPPENRNPTKDEIRYFSKYLDKEIGDLKPKMIVTLGHFSSKYIVDKYVGDKIYNKISDMHGRLLKGRNFSVFPSYHPASIIYNRKLEKVLKADFKKLRQWV